MGARPLTQDYWRLPSGSPKGRRTGVALPRILEASGAGARAGEAAELPVVTGITASEVYESGPEMSKALSPVVTPVGIVKFT